MHDQIAPGNEPGDEHAFDLILRQYWVRLFAFDYKFLNDPEEHRKLT